MEDEIKICEICGKEYHKLNFRNIFHKMRCCGNINCKRKLNSIRESSRKKRLRLMRGQIKRYILCKYCNKEVIKKANNQIYCNKKCTEKWHTNKKPLEEVIRMRTKICKNCNKKFIGRKESSETCSDKCSKEYYFKSNKEEVIKRNNINYRIRENKRRKKLGLPFIGEGYKSQNELLMYIKELFSDLKIVTNNYKILNGLQLDIYIPSLKLAFEYQGYQHFIYPNFFHKSKEEFEALRFRDKRKKELCEKNGIILIEISCFEKLSLSLIINKLNNINIKTKQQTLNIAEAKGCLK